MGLIHEQTLFFTLVTFTRCFLIDSLSAIVVFVSVEILENPLTGERTAVESAEGTTSVLTVLE